MILSDPRPNLYSMLKMIPETCVAGVDVKPNGHSKAPSLVSLLGMKNRNAIDFFVAGIQTKYHWLALFMN